MNKDDENEKWYNPNPNPNPEMHRQKSTIASGAKKSKDGPDCHFLLLLLLFYYYNYYYCNCRPTVTIAIIIAIVINIIVAITISIAINKLAMRFFKFSKLCRQNHWMVSPVMNPIPTTSPSAQNNPYYLSPCDHNIVTATARHLVLQYCYMRSFFYFVFEYL